MNPSPKPRRAERAPMSDDFVLDVTGIRDDARRK